MKSKIMYIEHKGGSIVGTGRIGRVVFFKTGKTLYYRGCSLQSLRGGYKANYYDVGTGETYWISGCKKDGQDTLYPDSIEIDENVREEYWNVIRKQPENTHRKTIRSEGKYSSRKPR